VKTRAKVGLTVGGLFFLVALGVVSSLHALRQIAEATRLRNNTTEAIRKADGLVSELKDAETGQRGYLLTRDEAFLEPYEAVVSRIAGDRAELLAMPLEAGARAHLEAASPWVDAKLGELAKAIAMAERGDWSAAVALVRTKAGKEYMDAIRAELLSFERIEAAALQRQEAAYQADMRLLFAGIAAGSVLAMAFSLLLAWQVYRDAQNRQKNLIHLETRRLLEIQMEIADQLKRANGSLQASEEKLAVIVRSIGDGLIATDAEGRVTFLNSVAEHLTGWTQAEAANRPVGEIFNIINQETRRPGILPVAETLAKGTIQGLANHTILISRDGREVPVADSCSPMRDGDRRVVGAVLVFRDDTERQTFEHALEESNAEMRRATAAAEEANHAKSEFLSSMSHELRTPLNAILGFGQLLESSAPTPAQAIRIHQILKAGWHLLNLINEILDLAVIESGKMSLSLEPVCIIDVLDECHDMMEAQAEKRGIVMVFPKNNSSGFVRADRNRLKQIVINLLSNAIKYNRESGSVVVECRPLTPGTVRISVRDTGAGLTPEHVAQLFQPFNRLGQETGGIAGTGIGLVVTKKLAALIGGEIGLKSTPGEGSVFWVDLPTSVPPKLAAGDADLPGPGPAAPGPGGACRTLLYVEDNPANMLLIEDLIAQVPNLKLLTAVDGVQGIGLARATHPELILMDINLPGISGVEAMKILRANPETALIPVIALSANAMPRDVKRGLEEGFFGYITKPIRVTEFIATLNRALKHVDDRARSVSETPAR